MITSFCKSMCNFSFRGRSNKKEFVSFLIIWLLISLIMLTTILFIAVNILSLNFNITNGLTLPYHKMTTFGLISFITMCLFLGFYLCFCFWSFVSLSLLSIRRCHDLNYSGVCYWIWISAFILFSVTETSVLTMFLAYFLLSCIIILIFANSFPSENKYGKLNTDDFELQINKQHG